MGDGNSLYFDLRGGYRVYTSQNLLSCTLKVRAFVCKLYVNKVNLKYLFSISFRINSKVLSTAQGSESPSPPPAACPLCPDTGPPADPLPPQGVRISHPCTWAAASLDVCMAPVLASPRPLLKCHLFRKSLPDAPSCRSQYLYSSFMSPPGAYHLLETCPN